MAVPGRFATLATVDADGWPLQAVIWYELRADGILFNSAVGRRWPANLQHDPRASLMVEDRYDYVAIRGEVEVRPDPVAAQADIARLARSYLEPDEAERVISERFQKQVRISFLLRPRSITLHR